jgi:hypothetical protein
MHARRTFISLWLAAALGAPAPGIGLEGRADAEEPKSILVINAPTDFDPTTIPGSAPFPCVLAFEMDVPPNLGRDALAVQYNSFGKAWTPYERTQRSVGVSRGCATGDVSVGLILDMQNWMLWRTGDSKLTQIAINPALSALPVQLALDYVSDLQRAPKSRGLIPDCPGGQCRPYHRIWLDAKYPAAKKNFVDFLMRPGLGTNAEAQNAAVALRMMMQAYTTGAAPVESDLLASGTLGSCKSGPDASRLSFDDSASIARQWQFTCVRKDGDGAPQIPLAGGDLRRMVVETTEQCRDVVLVTPSGETAERDGARLDWRSWVLWDQIERRVTSKRCNISLDGYQRFHAEIEEGFALGDEIALSTPDADPSKGCLTGDDIKRGFLRLTRKYDGARLKEVIFQVGIAPGGVGATAPRLSASVNASEAKKQSLLCTVDTSRQDRALSCFRYLPTLPTPGDDDVPLPNVLQSVVVVSNLPRCPGSTGG